MSMLEYGFMQRAFIVGILLAVITPCIGITIVLKRMSMIGDALSHSSLAGVAAGLLLGINPVLGAGVLCIIAALSIEAIRKKLPRYSEMAIAIVMSAGIGLAGVLSGFVKNTANFNSFLFGSIVSISTGEMAMVCLVSVVVLAAVLLLYKELFYIGFDENAARISGVPVKTVNFIFTVLTAPDDLHCVQNGWDADRLLDAGSACGLRDAGGEKLPVSTAVGHWFCTAFYSCRSDAVILYGAETGWNDRTDRGCMFCGRCAFEENSPLRMGFHFQRFSGKQEWKKIRAGN